MKTTMLVCINWQFCCADPNSPYTILGLAAKEVLRKGEEKMSTRPPYQDRSWWWVPVLQSHRDRWWRKVQVRSRGVQRSTTRSWRWSCGSTCGPGWRCSSPRRGTGQKEWNSNAINKKGDREQRYYHEPIFPQSHWTFHRHAHCETPLQTQTSPDTPDSGALNTLTDNSRVRTLFKHSVDDPY